jgi:hypothetical protein
MFYAINHPSMYLGGEKERPEVPIFTAAATDL